jgi:hypothetical protein
MCPIILGTCNSSIENFSVIYGELQMVLISLRQLVDHAAAKKLVRDRFEFFGCVGKAALIQPLYLDKMAELYVKGSLRAQVH